MGYVKKNLPMTTMTRLDKKSFVTKWAGKFTTPKTKPHDLRMRVLKKKYGLTAQ